MVGPWKDCGEATRAESSRRMKTERGNLIEYGESSVEW